MIALVLHGRRSGRRSVRIAFMGALLAALVAPPQAATAATLLLDPASGQPGTTVDATANGFLGGPVTFWWDNELLLGTDPSGRVRHLNFTVPSDADPGQHIVRACQGSACPPGSVYDDASFVVSSTSTPKPPKPTPEPTPEPTPRPTPRPTPAPTVPPSPRETPAPTASFASGSSASLPVGAATAVASTVAAGPVATAPGTPGTVSVEFPWLVPVIGLGLGILVLLFLLDNAWKPLIRLRRGAESPAAKLMPGLTAGTHDPPKAGGNEKWLRDRSGKVFGPDQPAHELAHTSQSGADEPAPTSFDDPTADGSNAGGTADHDVKLKGSKIKEN